MSRIEDVLLQYKDCNVAIYGIGTETERFINQYENGFSFIGLLDGFRESGKIYNYPIVTLKEVVRQNVKLIIVVARPGSCKVIAKRVRQCCINHGIALIDVRGKDLLYLNEEKFDFSTIKGNCKKELIEKIDNAEIISFDLFDTLITRNLMSYTDVFELMEIRLIEKGIIITDFAKHRLYAEKELSRYKAPRIEEIYHFILEKSKNEYVTVTDLVDLEWEIDIESMVERKDVCDIFRKIVSSGKKVVITTDSYYSEMQIMQILTKFSLKGIDNIFISCEYGKSKTQKLFSELNRIYQGNRILHIGDDIVTDIEKPSEMGFDTYQLYSSVELYDLLGGVGVNKYTTTLSDRIKVGIFVASIFNSPFWFEEEQQRLSVSDVSQIGYLFYAPLITDFILWMKERVSEQGYKQILFCARDGYLPMELYKKISPETNSVYFLTSRIAAIRAGIQSNKDIEYVDSMRYFGSLLESSQTRFGIKLEYEDEEKRKKIILDNAKSHRENYLSYIKKLNIKEEKIGMFDFVAKGTTQMYVQRLFKQHIKGFYFLQLEKEFMVEKGINVEAFFLDDEKNDSAIFDNYYIMETILSSPYSQVVEFNKNGEPQFANETRQKKDIEVMKKIQDGIIHYFDTYISMLPESIRTENKLLDEKMLILINKIVVNDDFMMMRIEDPFFGRTTEIKDVLG